MEYWFILSIILFSQSQEVILGFGGTFFALILSEVFGLHNFGIWTLIPINIFLNILIIYSDRKSLKLKTVLMKTLPFMFAGFFIIHLLPFNIPHSYLKIFCGILLITLVLIKNIYFSKALGFFSSFVSGIAYATIGAGGPFISLFVHKLLGNKSATRGNLSFIWLSMNLLVVFRMRGEILQTPLGIFEIFGMFFIMLLSFYFGQKIHKKLRENQYTYYADFILIIMGVLLIIKN